MPGMLQRLRSSRTRSLVLLGYALLVVAGLLSSVLAPGDFQILCLGNGGKTIIAVNSDGDLEPASDEPMACPLANAVMVPIYAGPTALPPSPLEHATRPAVVARLIALAGAPLPPRGTPRI